MAKRILPFLFCLLLLSSCTVLQTFTADSGEEGFSNADIEVDQFFLDVLEDLSDVLPRSDASIMDQTVMSLAEKIYDSDHASGTWVQTTGDSRKYILSFSYSSLTHLVEDLTESKESTIFQITGNSLSFHLDIHNYSELKAFVPVLSDPNFEVYGPEYNYGTTKEAYMEMIGFLLDERGPEALEKSMVSIVFEAPSAIKDTVNMTKDSDTMASITFPLIDLLLLNDPIEFSLNW